MKKCEMVAAPLKKLREVLVAPDKQNIFRQAKQSTEIVLAELRKAREIDPKRLREPYNL